MNKTIRNIILISAFGMTPVFASAGSSVSSHGSVSPSTIQTIQYHGSENSFVSAWNEARIITPWNGVEATSPTAKNSMSSSATSMAKTSCTLSPRIGFNQDNNFPSC